jgi:drug/metabolite transporter (DMT)-like permease
MPGMLPSEASAAANSSFAWVYMLSLFMLGETLDWIKVFAVLLTLGGVILLALSALQGQKAGFSVGIVVEFGCAVSQAFYFVAFRKWAVRNGTLPPLISAMITGFIVRSSHSLSISCAYCSTHRTDRHHMSTRVSSLVHHLLPLC